MTRQFDFYPLEDRVLLSGDSIDATGTEPVDGDLLSALVAQLDNASGEAPGVDTGSQFDFVESDLADQQSPPIGETSRFEVVFVDAAVDDRQDLIQGIDSSNLETQWLVIELSSDADGISQISQTLAGLSGVDAVHLVSHGDGSGIQLGNQFLDLSNAHSRAGEIAQWTSAFSQQADLLIYGCDLASTSEGRTFAESLAAICDCDVAASDDQTGHTSLGGDWEFEYTTGIVESHIAFSALAQQSWYSSLDIASNLVGQYSFEENGGAFAADGTGNSIGVIINSPSWDGDSAVGDYAFDFAGDAVNSNSHVIVGDSAAQDFGTDSFTVSFWYNASTPTSVGRIVGDTDGVSPGFIIFVDSFGDITLQVDDGIASSFSTSGYFDSTWRHYTVTYDNATNKLAFYHDAVKELIEPSVSLGDISTSNQLTIGSSDPIFGDFEGKLDEVRLYTRALSATDVAELYAQSSSSPQTFVVTNTNDNGSGSLRDAIAQANANAGHLDTIEFSISGSGPHTINLATALPNITDSVFIDGWSESDYNGDGVPVIVVNGSALGGSADGIVLDTGSDGSTVRGLVVERFGGDGIEITTNNNWVHGNYVGVDATGLGLGSIGQNGIKLSNGASNNLVGTDGDGSSDTRERNVIGGSQNGIWISDAGTTLNTIAGNYIGVGSNGSSILANSQYGIAVNSGATNNTIGGDTNDEKNVVSGNDSGILVSGSTTNGNILQGNAIGVSSSGNKNIGNAADGIFVTGGADNTLIQNNIVSGSGLVGIEIDGTSSNTQIYGNRIGTDSSGTLNWGSGENGILLENGASYTIIGGITAGQGNIVAFSGQDSSNYQAGIGIVSNSVNNTVRGNSVYANEGLGIDLSNIQDDGHDLNDTGDGDTGGNLKQNWAILTAASIDDAGQFSYKVDTTPLATGSYQIDFYASSDLAFGEVEGEQYLGSVSGVVNGNSNLSGTLSGVTLNPGDYITLVTTDASGNSSEFSNYAVTTDADANGTPPSDLTVITTTRGGVSLNEDGGNDAYLKVDDSNAVLGGRTAFTFEFQYSSTDDATASPFVSYAVDGDANHFLLERRAGGSLAIAIDGTIANANAFDFDDITDGHQHTVSFTWDNADGDWQLYIDGALVESGTGLAEGHVMASNGVLLFGQEQDQVEGGFDSNSALSATIYDIRVFDDVRTAQEISTNYAQSIAHDASGLIANWMLDHRSRNEVFVDSVSGNQLKISHTVESGFTPGTPELTLEVLEQSSNGTVVGTVIGSDAERDALISQILSDPNLYYSEETGKFYRYVDSNQDWSTSYANSVSNELNGIAGELVQIRSSGENQLIVDILNHHGAASSHIGATDQFTEGAWRWSNDIAGDQFWTGSGSGSNLGAAYSNWESGEPNNAVNEDFAVLNASTGQWDDRSSSHTAKSIIQYDADAVLNNTGLLGSQPLTYAILSQSVAGAFAIDPNTGAISVANGLVLDNESLSTHTITVEVTDTDNNTYQENVDVQIVDNQHEITLSLPIAQSTNEGTPLVFNDLNVNKISLAEQSANDERVQVTLTVSNGTLSLSGVTGIEFREGANGTATMTIEGAESDINAALDGLTYLPSSEFSGSDTLQIATSLTADLVGHYSFDSGLVDDQSAGTADDGALINATTTIDPERGEVLLLDGSDDSAEIPGRFGDPPSVTLAAWINTSASQLQEIISLGDSIAFRVEANGNLTMFQYDSGGLNLFTTDGIDVRGEWNHVAVSFDDGSGALTLYLNGDEVLSTNGLGSISYSRGANTIIGAHGFGSNSFDFSGMIGDAMIYDRALTAGNVWAIANEQTELAGNVAITVDAVNDAPALNSNQLTINEGGVVVITSSELNATDTDNTDAMLTFAITGVSGGQFELVSAPGSPVTSFTQADVAAGNVRFVHDSNEAAPAYNVSVSDGSLSDGPEAASITFSNRNDAPNITTNTGIDVDEGATVTINNTHLSSSDADDTATGLIYSVTSSPSSGHLQLSSAPGVSISSFTQADLNAGILEYVHDDSETTSDSFDFTLADGGEDGAASVPGTFTISIDSINDHSITSLTDANPTVNSVLENSAPGTLVGITGFASDGDAADNVIYSLDDDDGGRFTIDSISGLVTTAATLDRESDGATRTITIRATSDDGSFSNQAMTVSIDDIDEYDVSPAIDSDSSANEIAENSAVGTAVGITAFATDADATDSGVSYSMIKSADGRFTIDSATGEVTVADELDYESFASHFIEIRATSDDGSFQDAVFTVNVTNENETPTATLDTASTISGQSVTIDALSNDFDEDGDSLSVTIVAGPAHGVVVIDASGNLIYTPNGDFFGDDIITYEASDGLLNSTPVSMTISVQAAPIIVNTGTDSADASNSDSGSTVDSTTEDSDEDDSQDETDESDSDPPTGSIASSASNEPASDSSETVDSQFNFRSFRVNSSGSANDNGQPILFDRVTELHSLDLAIGATPTEVEMFERLLQLDLEQSIVWQQWDDNLSNETSRFEMMVGSATASASLLSLAYVFWTLRGGAFLAAFTSSIPSWRLVDPGEILSAYRSNEDDAVDVLDQMLGSK